MSPPLDGCRVDVHGLALGQQGEEGAARGDPGASRARARDAAGAEGDELAALPGQEEGQLAQAERRSDPLEEPLARPLEVEVGVEVLGEPHEGLARAVALLVEEPVERLLDPGLDRREEQHDHEGAQERDERRVRLLPQHVCQSDGQEGEPHDHRHGQDVAERAAEDELHVHQAVLHHGVGERERDQCERPVAGELEREPGLAAEGEGQRVEGQEGEDASRGAPQQPLDLPARGEPARAPVGLEQDREGDGEEDGEVERLRPGERLHDAPEGAGLLAGSEESVARGRGAGEDQGRHVQRRDEPRPVRARAPFREGQAEVEEDHGQEEAGERVGPEEDPVESGELPGVRGGVAQEEQRAHRVEVHGRPVGGPAQKHHRADDEAEEAGQRQVEERADVAPGQRQDRDVQGAALVLAQQRVRRGGSPGGGRRAWPRAGPGSAPPRRPRPAGRRPRGRRPERPGRRARAGTRPGPAAPASRRRRRPPGSRWP